MLFIDDKELQRELKSHIVNRLLKFELSPADKLLVRPYVERYLGQQASYTSKAGFYAVKDLLDANATDNAAHELESYSHLSLYCVKKNELKNAIESAHKEYNGKEASLPLECYQRAKEDAARMIIHGENGKPQTDYMPLLIHNADLKLERRSEVEKILESWYPQWDLVLATSALEVGVNVGNAGVILQYGLPALPEVVVQRFGRGGRSEDALYVSVGVLMPRHTGEDVALIDEDYAVQRLFGFKPSFLHDERSDARYKTILMLVGFNAFAKNSYKCNQGRDTALLYIDYSSAMLAVPRRDYESYKKAVVDALYHSCALCSSFTDFVIENITIRYREVVTEHLKYIAQWTSEWCKKEELPDVFQEETCRDAINYLCQLCSSTSCKRQVIENLLHLVHKALLCSKPLIQKKAGSVVRPVSDILSIYASLLAIRRCKKTSFQKCCMENHLTVLAQPAMPHPYLIIPTLEVFTIDVEQREEKHNKQIDEVYDLELPLKIRDI